MMEKKETAYILVIGSHQEMLKYYQRFLQTEGYDIKISTFIEENVLTISQIQPDLILFDLLADTQQEKLTLHLIEHLKAEAATTAIPLLVCTVALVLPNFATAIQRYQIPTFFKPFRLIDLGREIRSLLL
jgi:response regulator RpfG family c-di-GMP phosphodiesterase